MARISVLDSLSNPLVSADQLSRLKDSASLYWTDDAQSIRFAQAQLTQTAGVLLRLPQEVITNALVVLQRVWLHHHVYEEEETKLLSAAALYLTAKLSFTPVSPRSVINVYAYLLSAASPLWFIQGSKGTKLKDPQSYHVTEGTYERERQSLFDMEHTILSAVGFDTRVALPHTIALTYLQALGVSKPSVSSRVLEHLNGALLSPQTLYLTHQPNALAVAAIYLAARETNTKLVDGNWWEVFDVDREDLGFLVHAYSSLQGFAEREKARWAGRKMPLGID